MRTPEAVADQILRMQGKETNAVLPNNDMFVKRAIIHILIDWHVEIITDVPALAAMKLDEVEKVVAGDEAHTQSDDCVDACRLKI